LFADLLHGIILLAQIEEDSFCGVSIRSVIKLKNTAEVLIFLYLFNDPDVEGMIILRWIFRKWEGVLGTGWSGLRIG
jgi:hypothetical protein